MAQITRQKINFNEGWKFLLEENTGAVDYSDPAFNDAQWRELVLPHDWDTEHQVEETNESGGGGGYARGGLGWYRKRFTAPEGGRTVLQFDGVYQNSTVYLNGKKAGGWNYGYSEFIVDITGLLKPGENLLAVRVDNSKQPNSRWYSGSGIYRNVYLLKLNDVHLKQNSVFIATNGIFMEKNAARLQIQSRVQNEGKEPVDVIVQQKIFDADGNEVCQGSSVLGIEPGDESFAMVAPALTNPRLWSDKDPYLYTVETSLIVDSNVVDTVTNRTGIRTAVFDGEKGFLLNGIGTKIKGMCIHHDCGLAGAANYREIWERRLKRLRDMGCNGIRTAHNPPSVEFLDLCDELGFLVMDEAFDQWYMSKRKYGYGMYFARDHEADLVKMIHRDRNHPSVVIWSIGNEIPEQSTLYGPEIIKELQGICNREDPTRHVTSGVQDMKSHDIFRTTEDFENALDVLGYNYVARWDIRAETLYDNDKKMYPNRKFLGAENPSAGGRRGFYQITSPDGIPLTPYDYDKVTLNNAFLWRYTATREFVAGDYLWTGLDYLGESRWPSKNATYGPIDTAGFQKDTYYYFRSIWNDEKPTLHILPHWNWKGREGEYVSVIGYTNYDAVSLYVNGKLVGHKGYDFPNVGASGAWNTKAKNTRPTTHDLHLQWDVLYEPGELKAVAYTEGKPSAELVIKTTGEAVKLKAKADTVTIPRFSIAHIEIETEDKDGLFVPTAESLVRAKAEVNIQFLGMDNGNNLDLRPFPETERNMLAGRLLCIVRGMEKGSGKLTLSADGLNDVIIDFKVE